MSDAIWKKLEERIEWLIEQEKFAELQSLLEDVHPADIAFILSRLDRVSQHIVFDLLGSETASDVLVELSDHTQERVLGELDEQRLADLVDMLDSDEAADVLGSVEPEIAEKVLETLPEEQKSDVQQLLTYDEDTAGGIMSTELVSVEESMTVEEVIDEVRSAADRVDDIYAIWVVDSDGVLRGSVTLKNLILAEPNTRVGSLMDSDVRPVVVDMDQEEVVHIMRRYDLVAAPVVDSSGKLLGRITWDDAIDVMNEESEEDLGYISGTGEEEPSARSVFNSSRERIPWLIAGLFGGIISALVMSGFEQSLNHIIVLAFFVPIITAMGGNVGMQSSTIIVRGLATGEITYDDAGQRIAKELGVALLNGAMLGLILTLIIWFWQKELEISLVISFSLLVVILVSSIIGVAAPLMLKKINIDPALAMGPFVTISNDIFGVFIYLSIATVLLVH
ncbi:MAG: magnesium transporter [candidate division Zixibacteria bacterium]|nr:magnesium transporter [Candidatus Tariuqbacter arcticus]